VKLLFVSQYIYRPEQPGANRIYDFLQRLATRGHQPHVVVGGVHYLEDHVDPELARKKFVYTRWGTVPVTVAYAAARFRRGVISRLRSYFSFGYYAGRALMRVGRVDAVMVSIQPPFVAPLAWLVARLRGARFIVEVRDLWPDAAIEVGLIRSRTLIWLGHRLEMFIYRRARNIVTIGPEMKRVIESKGIDGAKIEVMPQGYQPPPRPVRSREQARRELRLDHDAFVLMFTGSFGLANNDVRSIVAAAARLRDEPRFTLVMVGEGNLKQECVDRCRREGLDHVRFLPMVPKSDVADLLAAADAAIMTLPRGDFWKICLQNKLFDYMGNGVPVVAALAGDQEDILRRAEGGIVVPPQEIDQLVEAILRLKRNPELARRLGRNARDYVRQHLMRDRILDDYVDLIERVVPVEGGAPLRDERVGS
jgi:glycosyltransferase involved in cell wall biosynthesis